ncbi:leucine-rich repeat protein [Alkaliphilus peptidifermentans]|uniref:Copper amine oxidase N-terminal domain-containing protein n=1 Tax=Alkaliphilus peptidifermentans DSM 18978 TaxID=1120976 RepID=A0A1G5L4Q7_9FIRM|nr:leucine-rich repeat protein [Alkaliphilus peptidifermentans]SCZ07855.1 Copper amine oxidase N-terminal domain-containing protein [Alkaliphilus peptidifermentans DSM 18978]
MKKKIFNRLPQVLVMALILLMLPTLSIASAEPEFDIQNNFLMRDLDNYDEGYYKVQDNVLVKYNGNAKHVVIPKGVTAIDTSAFADNNNIESVIIPDGVTHINAMAFYMCRNLKEIEIPDSVQYIGFSAFFGCDSLTSIELPKGLIEIPEQAFFSCDSLKNVTIPEGVRSIGAKAFVECSSLTKVVIPSSVKVIGAGAFSQCSSLNTVTISEGVTTIKGTAFSNCTNLKEVTIPSSVTEIGKNAFGTSSFGNVSGFTIRCEEGSEAERYALENCFNIIITEKKAVTETIEAPTTEVVSSNVIAKPTIGKVLVNGVEQSFEAYNIDGNNYFKLRDLAMVVSGTVKQFEVAWDGEKNAINLISGKPYTVSGGEMNKGDGLEKIGQLNTSKIYKDGNEIKIIAYNINSNNYFKLRDVAQAFNIGVTWDEATSTIAIDTSIGYVEP